MPEINIEQIVMLVGYWGIFLLMIANGFISFPSSQILYALCGYFIFQGNLTLFWVVFAGATGNTIGNIILYEVARKKGLEYLLRFQVFPEKEVRKANIAFQKKGPLFLFIGKLIPALKVFVPIPAGIARMNRGLYASIILVSSVLWSFIFIALGYYFGKSLETFGKFAPILFVVALIVIGLFYRYMNSPEIIREVEGK